MYQPLASTGQEYNQAPSEADGSHCFTSLTFVHGMCPTMYSESIFTHAFPLCSCHKNFMKLLSHWNKVFGASWPVFWQLGMLGVIWEEGTSLEAIPPPHWLMGEPVASSWLATDVGGHILQYVVFSLDRRCPVYKKTGGRALMSSSVVSDDGLQAKRWK